MSVLNRRDFIKAAGVGATSTVAVGCDWLLDPKVPQELALPYVVQPDQIVPGLSTWFTTACNECSAGCGVLARNREGRIVKLEGNPEHPVNSGKLCSRGLTGIQATYSPDRFEGPMADGAATDWDTVLTRVGKAVTAARAGGKKVAWLGRYRTGALSTLLDFVIGTDAGSRVHWEPLGDDALRAATSAVFGISGVPRYVLDDAHTIVSFGADFLGPWGSQVELSTGYANSRDPAHGDFISRHVSIEPRAGASSALSDLMLAVVPGTEVGVALALARLVAEATDNAGAFGGALSSIDVDAAASAAGIDRAKLDTVAGWMAEHPSVVLPGDTSTSARATDLAVATLVLNVVAGNVGKSVVFGNTANTDGRGTWQQASALLADCAAGKVSVLFLDDLDPVFSLPEDAGVGAALAAVETLVVFANEPTDTLAKLPKAIVLPTGSTLETWGAHHATRGVHTIQQPGMMPLKDTRSTIDVLLGVAKAAGLADLATSAAEAAATAATEAGHDLDAGAWQANDDGEAPQVPDLVQAAWQTAADAAYLAAAHSADFVAAYWREVVWSAAGNIGDFEAFWVQCLQRGGWFDEVASTGATPSLAAMPAATAATPAGDGLVVLPFAHPYLHDGRHANRPWAQEVPEPISTYTWGTWIEVHPDTAAKLGLVDDQGAKVTVGGKTLEVGWAAVPSMHKDAVGIVMGNGHKASGRYAKFGSNPVTLLNTAADAAGGGLSWVSARAKVSPSGAQSPVFARAGNEDMDGRGLNFTVSKDDLGTGSGPQSIVPMHHVPIDERLTSAGLNDMYPEPEHPTYRFAMAVDLNRCTGCGACETACYSENNLPVVGPEQIRLSRTMGWIRLSRYWEGSGETPDLRFQPVMCQHCSHAPCEGVCPVLATYHNLDGLNAMIYNRCVGTRYCGNNCPYTARRFNFHTFRWPEPFNMMLNPDVNTRDMGVMEKCSFCVQRIRDIKDRYRDDKQTVPSSALTKLTACASACPADAITFGNAKDPDGEIAKKFSDERAYSMLYELNTKPGVRYLSRIVHTPSALHHGGGHGDDHGDASGGHGKADDHGDAGGAHGEADAH